MFSRVLFRFTDWLIPPSQQGNSFNHQQQRLAVAFLVVTSVWAPIFGLLLYFVLDSAVLTLSALVGIIVGLAILLLLKFYGSFVLVGNLLAATLYGCLTFSSACTTGIDAPAQMWLVAIPMVAVLLAGTTSGFIWTVLVVVQAIVFFTLPRLGIVWESALTLQDQAITRLTSMIALPILTFTLCFCYEIVRTAAVREIRSEQQLLKRFLGTHEIERKLLAYDIHDGLVQQLTAASMYNESGLQSLTDSSLEEAREAFQQAGKLLAESINEARRVISGLRPPILDELGIVAAMDYLVHEHQVQTDAAISFTPEVEIEQPLHPLLESALFRACQELLTNACRYSQADQIQVTFSQRDQHFVLAVEDDGIGFSPTTSEESFGLRGIHERARLLGGKATVQSQSGAGTQVRVKLPIVSASADTVAFH